jgi:hypothetical protein
MLGLRLRACMHHSRNSQPVILWLSTHAAFACDCHCNMKEKLYSPSYCSGRSLLVGDATIYWWQTCLHVTSPPGRPVAGICAALQHATKRLPGLQACFQSSAVLVSALILCACARVTKSCRDCGFVLASWLIHCNTIVTGCSHILSLTHC